MSHLHAPSQCVAKHAKDALSRGLARHSPLAVRLAACIGNYCADRELGTSGKLVFGANDQGSMGHPSPATQMLQQARHLQMTDLDSDVDPVESSSTQVLGIPRSWLEDDYDSDSASSSYRDDSYSSCMQQLSLQCNTSDLISKFRHQQQVCRMLGSGFCDATPAARLSFSNMQAELQHILGIHSCRLHQIDCAEDWGLQDIADEHVQRQVLLSNFHPPSSGNQVWQQWPSNVTDCVNTFVWPVTW